MMEYFQRQFACGHCDLETGSCNSMDTGTSMPGNSPRDVLIASRDVTVLSLALTRAKH